MAEILVPPPEPAEEAHRFWTPDHISALSTLALPPVSMAEVAKVSYVVVLDDEEKKKLRKDSSFRYTRPVLQSTLQLMGCKARHAFKISKRAFELIRNQNSKVSMLPEESECCYTSISLSKAKVWNHGDSGEEDQRKSIPFELYKNLTTVTVGRETFLDYVCDALAEYKYVGTNQRADLILACRIRERKESITILLCGTSGCGKSTLSSLLGNRLGITTVLSTDSIRHMMRSFVDEEKNPLLWASTYHAGEFLDPVAVAEAKSKRKAKKMDGISNLNMKDDVPNGRIDGKFDAHTADQGSFSTDLISRKQMAIEGYKAQSEMVIDSLDRLITAWEEHKESVIVEGVHLSLNFVMGLMKKHPSIIPFMIHIVNEDKHLERFAVRAKYMTLDPEKNKYVKYIRNIRTIQEYLCKQADKHLVPKINNTNVDKSIAAIHATVFGCLRRRGAGELLLDLMRNTVTVVDEEYRNQCAANSLSSKGMFQLIQRKGSSRSLMALVNNDGSVARAWPVDDPIDRSRKHSDTDVSKYMYGPLQIDKAEPVNLQFGLYGISAWPNDGGTSRTGSVDESRADGTETGSRYFSSCCSSPRMSDAPAKELKEDNSVNGSDEEVDDLPELSSDDDYTDEGDKQIHEEVGSVDEESTKSDEEYDDLAMQDMQKDGHWSDPDDEYKEQSSTIISTDQPTFSQDDSYRYSHKTNFEFCSVSESVEFPSAFSRTSGNVVQMRERSLSIPIFSRASDR